MQSQLILCCRSSMLSFFSRKQSSLLLMTSIPYQCAVCFSAHLETFFAHFFFVRSMRGLATLSETGVPPLHATVLRLNKGDTKSYLFHSQTISTVHSGICLWGVLFVQSLSLPLHTEQAMGQYTWLCAYKCVMVSGTTAGFSWIQSFCKCFVFILLPNISNSTSCDTH